VDEFEYDIIANPVNVAVMPALEVEAIFDLIRRSIKDVDAATIRRPAGDAGREVFVGIGETAIVFFFEFVSGILRGGVSPLPELYYELLAFFVCLQALEGGSLLIRYDVRYILFQPLPVARLRLLPELTSFVGLSPGLAVRTDPCSSNEAENSYQKSHSADEPRGCPRLFRSINQGENSIHGCSSWGLHREPSLRPPRFIKRRQDRITFIVSCCHVTTTLP